MWEWLLCTSKSSESDFEALLTGPIRGFEDPLSVRSCWLSFGRADMAAKQLKKAKLAIRDKDYDSAIEICQVSVPVPPTLPQKKPLLRGAVFAV